MPRGGLYLKILPWRRVATIELDFFSSEKLLLRYLFREIVDPMATGDSMAAMPGATQDPRGRLVFTTSTTSASLTRQRKAGRAVRLAPGVFVIGSTLPVTELTTHYRWAIVEHFWPGAVVCDRSALSGGVADGWIFLCHPEPPRVGELKLEGLSVSCRVGPGPLPGDMPFMGLTMSGTARALLENMPVQGRPAKGRPSRWAGEAAVGDAIDGLASSGRPDTVQRVLAQLEIISDRFNPTTVKEAKRLLVAALGTVTKKPISSEGLAARMSGEPYDAERIKTFTKLRDKTMEVAPSIRILGRHPAQRTWLTFFEAYFSNYIEGTVFSPQEARKIAIDQVVPAARPADAHDVSATYRLVNDEPLMRQVAADSGTFVDMLRDRHSVLMAARNDKNPGMFKTVQNYAGGTSFVSPLQLIGTLRAGWDIVAEVVDPFHRAVLTMFVVTECHPFDDGNGRLARIISNAELVAHDQVRIIIPTCYRGNYLAALTAATVHGEAKALISALDYARRWVAAVDWTSWQSAMQDLESSNAFLDSAQAELSGDRLRLPPNR